MSELLSPSADPSVSVYASGGVRYDWRGDPTTVIDEVAGYVAAGYETVKIRLGTRWAWDAVTPDRFLALLRQLRGEVGDRVGIAIDGNSRLTREDALAVGHGIAELGGLFFEEPIAKDDLEGYVALNAALSIPVTGGESFTNREQFRPWIERRAFDIVQPDAGVCGITELMAIGAIADREGLALIPHSWHNGLMAMANAHCVAALPNAPMMEESMVQGPLKWDMLVGGTEVRGGRIDVTGRVGFGVEVIDSLERDYPYVEGHYGVEVFRRAAARLAPASTTEQGQSSNPALHSTHREVY